MAAGRRWIGTKTAWWLYVSAIRGLALIGREEKPALTWWFHKFKVTERFSQSLEFRKNNNLFCPERQRIDRNSGRNITSKKVKDGESFAAFQSEKIKKTSFIWQRQKMPWGAFLVNRQKFCLHSLLLIRTYCVNPGAPTNVLKAFPSSWRQETRFVCSQSFSSICCNICCISKNPSSAHTSIE